MASKPVPTGPPTISVEEIIREFYTEMSEELNLKHIAGELYAKGLINLDLKQTIKQEVKTQAANELFLDHLIRNGTLETLGRFCKVLEGTDKSHLPRHRDWSKKLKQKLTKYTTCPSDPTPQSSQDELSPTSLELKESSSMMESSQVDERSKKIKEIVDKYRNEEVSVPRNSELEDKFDDIMGSLRKSLLSESTDPGVICKLCGVIQTKYRRYINGVRPGPLPPIPDTAKGLYESIFVKSSLYEVLIVGCAVNVVGDEVLKKDFQEYKSKLCKFLQETFIPCENQRVPLPLHKGHTPIAVVISEKKVLLALMLELKEYFSKYLELEETLFEGFGEGCTVLFFSILTVDAALLSPKVLPHLSELKRMFGMTHLIVFGYFACDLEKATIELVYTTCSRDPTPQSSQDELSSTSVELEESSSMMESSQGLPSSSSPVNRGESTQTMSTMDERSKKTKEVVDKYKNGEGELFLPSNPDLEDELDDVMKALNETLSSADAHVISKLHRILRRKYRRYIHGVRPVPLPPVPNTADGLFDFIAEKSTPYEILLVHHAVEVLENKHLKKDLREYESKLAEHLKEMLMSCKRRRVTLPLRKDHTRMAVVVSKEQVLLSLVLEMKEYFSKYLQLEETLFEGFEEGCIVLFFSISRVDAALLSPKVLSHLSELKRMFGMTHLIVFGYFACDLEKATIELVSDNEDVVSLKTEKENELAAVRLSHQTESEKVTREKAKLEREKSELENNLIARGMKLKVKEEELDQSKKEAEMYKNSTVLLAKEKAKLEEELMTMRLEKSELEVGVENEIDEPKNMTKEEAEVEDFFKG